MTKLKRDDMFLYLVGYLLVGVGFVDVNLKVMFTNNRKLMVNFIIK